MSHVIVWEFRVRAGCERDFEEVYGPRGAWAALFARSPGFGGTELLRDAAAPGRYLTLDRWVSSEAFAELRRDHTAEYEVLDRRCGGWTEAETRIGGWVVTGG